MLAISNIVQGVISSIIASLMFLFYYEIKDVKKIEKRFVVESLDIISEIEFNLNLNLDINLLKRILSGGTHAIEISAEEKCNIIKEMEKVIKLKNVLSSKELKKIHLEYQLNYIIKNNMLCKSKNIEMKYIFDEIESMIILIKTISVDFDLYLKDIIVIEEKQDLVCCYKIDSIKAMLTFLSELYGKMYELRCKNGYSVYYNIWNYNTENKILLLNKERFPNQKLPDLEDFLFAYTH